RLDNGCPTKKQIGSMYLTQIRSKAVTGCPFCQRCCQHNRPFSETTLFVDTSNLRYLPTPETNFLARAFEEMLQPSLLCVFVVRPTVAIFDLFPLAKSRAFGIVAPWNHTNCSVKSS